jgi:hypothetical protein
LLRILLNDSSRHPDFYVSRVDFQGGGIAPSGVRTLPFARSQVTLRHKGVESLVAIRL